MGTGGEVGILGFDIRVVDGAIVPTVGFRSEVEGFTRVLREDSHEALESGPEGGGTGSSAGFGVVDVGVRESPAGIGRGIFRTCVVSQDGDFVGIGVDHTGHRDGVGEAHLGGLVDEDHVGSIGPGVGVVVDIAA